MRDKPDKHQERKHSSLHLSVASWDKLEALLQAQPGKTASDIVEDALSRYSGVNSDRETAELARLTPRQRDVLKLIGEGLSNKGIAAQLGISVKTVETHRTHLMKILNLHGVAGLVRFALRSGLITLGD